MGGGHTALRLACSLAKKNGAHSAWAHTCSQNLLEVSEKTNRKQERKLSDFSSEPFRGRDGIPFCGTKNRSKLSDCCSEPFHGRENNSEKKAAENCYTLADFATLEILLGFLYLALISL